MRFQRTTKFLFNLNINQISKVGIDFRFLTSFLNYYYTFLRKGTNLKTWKGDFGNLIIKFNKTGKEKNQR